MSGNRTENAAVFFTDVEGSTTYFKVYGDSAGSKLLLEHHRMVGEEVQRFQGTCVKTIGDSVLAYFSEPADAVRAAVAIQDRVEKHLSGRPPEEQFRIRIAIHYGNIIVEQNDIFGDVVNRASKLTHLTPGGDICVSRHMVERLKDSGLWSFEPLTVDDPDITAEKGAFRLLPGNRPESSPPDAGKSPEEEAPEEFRYRRQLVEGPHRPCFYCGSRRHRIGECPSKDLPEITEAFDKLGYMSVEDINLLFSEYIKRGCPGHESPVLIAHHAFYDLTRFFQLRFFRCVWDTEDKSWTEVSRNSASGPRWGTAWVSQDCIRVSNHGKAESLLAEPIREGRPDYKIHCASGFLNLEKGFLSKALTSFSTALRFTRSPVERIFVLFLLDRLSSWIAEENTEAKERLGELRIADPRCSEVIYLSILRLLKNGNTLLALKGLEKLIRDNRDYYVIALIDPELLNDAENVTALLTGLKNEARERAAILIPIALKALSWLEKSFDETNESVKAARASWARIQDLTSKKGYFAFEEAIRCSGDICSAYERELKSQKQIVSAGVESLVRRFDACLRYVRRYEGLLRITALYGETASLGEEIRRLRSQAVSNDPVTIREVLSMIETLTERIRDMEDRLRIFEKKRMFKLFAGKFLGSALVAAVAAVLVAFVFIPILWYTFRGLDAMLQVDMGSFQKGLLIVSLIGGCGLSLLSAFKTLYEH